jgi:hypothetical protein
MTINSVANKIWTAFGLLVAGTALTFMTSWYWVQRADDQRTEEKVAAARAEMQKRITELEKQLELVRQSVVPISTAFQAILIKELTHYHTPVMDALMVKLGPPYTLSEAEERELIAALEQRTRDMGELISPSERDAARMLPLLMKRVSRERSVDINTLQLKVVGFPKATDEK